jgi:LysM repeat protein
MLEQKNKGRARVKIAVSFVLIIHGIGLLALLVQGCHKDEPTTQKTEQAASNTAGLPALESTNTNVTTDANQTPANNTQVETKTPADTAPQVPAVGGTEYVIAKGDTYGTIATHYHVSVKALEEANPGVDEKREQPDVR